MCCSGEKIHNIECEIAYMKVILRFDQFCNWSDGPGRKVQKRTMGLYVRPCSVALAGKWEQEGFCPCVSQKLPYVYILLVPLTKVSQSFVQSVCSYLPSPLQ